MMTVPSLEELDSFKYSDLQNLAKSLGLRANQKADKLLKALRAHLEQETRKGKKSQDESQTPAVSWEEMQVQIGAQEQAEREPAGHITKTKRRRRTLHSRPDPQDLSETKTSDPTACQNPEEPGDLGLSAAVKTPPRNQTNRDESAMASGKGGIAGHEGSKVPSGKKKSLNTDGFSKSAVKKRIASTATPNFKKLHEAHFKEMESIDQYMERKKKHFEERSSLSELKKQPVSKAVVATPVARRGRVSEACTPVSQRRSQGRARAPMARNTSCVKRSGKSSATKMNVRFSATTKDNEHKRSLTKTPARKSPLVTVPWSTSKGQSALGTNKLMTPRRDSAVVSTPFKRIAEASNTPVSQKKPVFDLKASLSRPLNYEPHKGKLKPWGQSKENCVNEHVSRVSLHKNTYKQPRFKTRRV
ncbi:nucleolar and spindle-associated protein 1 isoform X1 [Sorex araneus]|uniref:nucleolar and spindle-associated protein 1 isoform X1 n=1 Tax=Sorex araneus TaxID=42254 RepID=UPI0024337CE3|nr:nucleolar and spindle-associated protein 1 isoform X1 [Sorex araneus]